MFLSSSSMICLCLDFTFFSCFAISVFSSLSSILYLLRAYIRFKEDVETFQNGEQILKQYTKKD